MPHLTESDGELEALVLIYSRLLFKLINKLIKSNKLPKQMVFTSDLHEKMRKNISTRIAGFESVDEIMNDIVRKVSNSGEAIAALVNEKFKYKYKQQGSSSWKVVYVNQGGINCFIAVKDDDSSTR